MKLVYTNDRCIGCNKCIHACSCMGANISVVRDGRTKIEVNPSKCIACGACFDVCEHQARAYEDDTERFFADLKRGVNISLLLAPSFKANYPKDYSHVLGALKAAGVNHIFNVSLGANITTWGYLNYITNYDFKGGISQPCAAVVGYVERYLPELIPKLFPIHSPMMCTAIYVSAYMGIPDRLAFIGPCIAKKLEMDDPNNGGLISYNITFSRLMNYIRRHGLAGEPADADKPESGFGPVYPMPGGLKENIQWFLGDEALIRQVEGEKRIYRYLNKNREQLSSGTIPYLFVDALNCEGGCLHGTGCEEGRSQTDDKLRNLYLIRQKLRRTQQGEAWSIELPPNQRLEGLNRQFQTLNLRDFIRTYTDRSSQCQYTVPDTYDLDRIFLDMEKISPEERAVNCSCCGYATCRDMAAAIHNGFSTKANCIYYVKKQAEAEKERALALAQEVNRQKQRIQLTVEELRQQINVEEAAMKCIRILIGEKDTETAIRLLLEIVTRFYHAERAYIFELDDDGNNMSKTCEWCAEGVKGERGSKHLPVGPIGLWLAEIGQRGAVHISGSKLKARAKALQQQENTEMESLIVAPMIGEGRDVGFIGVSNPSLNTEQVQLMQMLTSLVLEEMEKRRLIEQLKKMSYSDRLTGAGNRNRYIKVMGELQANPPDRLGIVYADVNGLKKINDSYGHKHGDEVLQYAAKMLKNHLGGALFRIGGDEFVSVNTDITGEEFEYRLSGLRKQLETEKGFGLAIGSQYRENSCDAAEQVTKADKMMYVDKHYYYQKFSDDRLSHRTGGTKLLLEEIGAGRFLVYLQPKVDLNSGEIIGAEALVRKKDDQGRLIAPDHFIPAYEADGIIRHVDFFVLETVCALLAEWREEGIILPVSVNLSRITLMEYDVVSSVKAVCEKYNIPPELIELEITESISQIDNAALLHAAAAFRQEGFALSLDDFGTQYSNLSILTVFEFDEVKFDRSLVSHLGENSKSDIIVRHAIDICRSFPRTASLAEGIETAEQERLLKEYQCKYGQGYLFSKPVGVEQFKEMYIGRTAKGRK